MQLLWEVTNITLIAVFCLPIGLLENRLTFFLENKMVSFLSHNIFLKSDLCNFRVISWRVQSCNFIKKETLAQVCSCKFCKIFKNTFFTEHLRMTASAGYYGGFSLLQLRNNFYGKPLMLYLENTMFLFHEKPICPSDIISNTNVRFL